ncbi:Cytochrome b-c1 complex subunit 8-1, mitochondrial, partial [Linum perenne]
ASALEKLTQDGVRREEEDEEHRLTVADLREESTPEKSTMGKQPVRMRAVIYALSPFQQKTVGGLFKDLPSKLQHKVSENWLSATLLLTPIVGVYTVCAELPGEREDGTQILSSRRAVGKGRNNWLKFVQTIFLL